MTNGNYLQVNQALKIPVLSTGAVRHAPNTHAARTPNRETKKYRVRSGDTLSGIARNHGISVAEMARLNGLSNHNRLSVGQVLLVPQVAGARPGFAARSTPAQAPIRSTPLVARQEEKIAAPLSPKRPVQFAYDGVLLSYKMLPSDTLETVAQTFMTTPETLAGINGLSSTKRPATGTTLLVPKPSYLDGNGFSS